MLGQFDRVNSIKSESGQQQFSISQKSPEPRHLSQTTGSDQIKKAEIRYLPMPKFFDELSRRLDSLEMEIEKLRYQFSVQVAVINTLGDNEFELKKPLNINIEHRSIDDFVACLYDADLYGYGESIPEAMDDLKSAIIDQFEYLQEQEKTIEFSNPLKKQLMFLNDILVNINV